MEYLGMLMETREAERPRAPRWARIALRACPISRLGSLPGRVENTNQM